jgi:CRISPR-associated endonuclease/helicase Cas3
VFEREAAARQLSKLGFLAGTGTPPPLPTFLFATSAAEVGVDLDADHMVCDLVAWERMVQRLGRVNRRGNGNAQVIVVAERPRAPNKTEQKALDANTADRTKKQLEAISAYERDVAEARARRRALDLLPDVDGLRDASPGAIRVLKRRGRTDADLAATLRAASTPEPLRPALTRALIDAWAMTSLEEHTGRPEIEPWLRGWVEKKPQTSIVWRHYLPVHADGTAVRDKEIEAFFEAAPPALIETLETETYRAVSWLVARADAITKRREPNPEDRDRGAPKPLRPTDIAAIALTPAGDFDRTLSLAELVGEGALEKLLEHARPAERADIRALRRNEDGPAREKTNDRLFRSTAGTTLIVDRRLGGLAASGLLDEAADGLPDTVDAGTGPLWPTGADTLPVHFRVQKVKGEPPQPDPDWRQQLRLVIDEPDEGDATCLVVHKWRHAASTEEGRSAGRPQSLGEHEEWAEDDARQLAEKLELPPPYAEMLCAATRLHDEGKRSPRWQRAFNAMADGRIYAKTLGPVNVALLDGYRHELGSLPHAEDNDRIRLLPEDLRDLALHLIAAHHGFARPVIRTSGCEDAPPSALMDRARDVALRFVRLQERWGPWGLAWWESLLRAADQQASRRNDEVKGE